MSFRELEPTGVTRETQNTGKVDPLAQPCATAATAVDGGNDPAAFFWVAAEGVPIHEDLGSGYVLGLL